RVRAPLADRARKRVAVDAPSAHVGEVLVGRLRRARGVGGVEVALVQVAWLDDMQVAVQDAEAVFHARLSFRGQNAPSDGLVSYPRYPSNTIRTVGCVTSTSPCVLPVT